MAELTRTTEGRQALAAHHRKMMVRGGVAALLLAVLSLAEFAVTKSVEVATWYMVPFMVLKGAVILQVFMHVSDVWKAGEH